MKLYAMMAIFTSLMVSGCASEKADPVTFVCIHPAIMGGAPFKLPNNALFLNHGVIKFRDPQGNKISVIGALCIEVEPAAQ